MWNLKKKLGLGKDKCDGDVCVAPMSSDMGMGNGMNNTDSLSTTAVSATQPSQPTTTEGQNLTLVELFQSQGCSSCPPSNANIISLATPNGAGGHAHADTLALTYEVTYWDYLGWKDTFGNKEFDVRQREYSAGFGSGRVYTPQVIVNGTSEGVGNTTKSLNSIIQKGKRVHPLTISVSPSKITLTNTGNAYHDTASIVLVTYVPNPSDVVIKRGENGGRTLPHKNVVVGLEVVGVWTREGGSVQSFDVSGKGRMEKEMFGGVVERAVFVQAGRGGPISGAARL